MIKSFLKKVGDMQRYKKEKIEKENLPEGYNSLEHYWAEQKKLGITPEDYEPMFPNKMIKGIKKIVKRYKK